MIAESWKKIQKPENSRRDEQKNFWKTKIAIYQLDTSGDITSINVHPGVLVGQRLDYCCFW